MKQINGNKQMTDVWRLPAIAQWEKSCGKHPTQKPLSLLARILLASTEKSGWVLDPFSGSGTTGIAANLLGRQFLGIDITEEFLEMSKKRREELENQKIRSDYLSKMNRQSPLQIGTAETLELFASEERAAYVATLPFCPQKKRRSPRVCGGFMVGNCKPGSVPLAG